MKKAVCFVFIGLLFAGFLRFLRIERGESSHAEFDDEPRATILKAFEGKV